MKKYLKGFIIIFVVISFWAGVGLKQVRANSRATENSRQFKNKMKQIKMVLKDLKKRRREHKLQLKIKQEKIKQEKIKKEKEKQEKKKKEKEKRNRRHLF